MTSNQNTEPTAPPSEEAQPAPPAGSFARRHPQLLAWAVLAVLMVAMVLYSARDVSLLASQRFFIILATVGLAGLCVWIIGWD